MSTLSKFLRRYGPEISALAGTVSLLVDRSALDPSDKANAREGIQAVVTGADNIMAGVDKLKEVSVSPAELKGTVEKLLPALVEKAVVKAVEEYFKNRAEVSAKGIPEQRA